MKESDIVYHDDNGPYWVAKTNKGYTIFKTGITHSVAVGYYGRGEECKQRAIDFCKLRNSEE